MLFQTVSNLRLGALRASLRRTVATSVILAACLGYASWGPLGITALAALAPLAWAIAPTRFVAFLAIALYYLAAIRWIPQSAAVFFGLDNNLVYGIALWVATAAANALPWALLHPERKTARSLAWRAATAALIGLLPPFAFIGWVSPLLGAAALFPRLALLAFVLGLVTLGVVAALPAVRSRALRAAVLVALAGAALLAERTPLPPAIQAWRAVTMTAGPYPETMQQRFARKKLVALEAAHAVAADPIPSVVVFPEQILGSWSPIETGVFIKSVLAGHPRAANTTFIFGATTAAAGSTEVYNSAVILANGHFSKMDARLVVPVSMWHPWEEGSHAINWTSSNVTTIDGKRTLFLFCYEEGVPFLTISSYLLDRPEAIISIVNAWWVGKTSVVAAQQQHIDALSKIFWIPVTRSVNGA